MFYLRIILSIIITCRNWPKLLTNRILTKIGLLIFAPSVQTIELKNGIKFSMGPSKTIGGADLFLISEIWNRKSYFLKSYPGFRIDKNDTVIDVGANRGYFTIFAARKAVNGKIFAFEPSPDNFEILSQNLKNNKLNNVVAMPMAVSSSVKNVYLYLFPGSDSANSQHLKLGKKIKVKATDLPHYCKVKKINKIDFLKIDCEGEEYEIFSSLPGSFWKIVDKISMEHHVIKGHSPRELVNILQSYKFKILKFDSKYLMAMKQN